MECFILHRVFNGEYDPFFYTQVREMTIQYLFGDTADNAAVDLSEAMVNVNSAGSIAIRSFEKLLPERGLSDSVANVLVSIREFTEEGIPALEFINYCISEYMRISDKRRRDENY